MTKDEKHLHYWKKFSALGKQKFALYIGMGWGAVTAVITEVVSVFLFKDPEGFSLVELLIRILIMSVIGYFYMRWHWSVNEKRYIQLQQEMNKETKTENSL